MRARARVWLTGESARPMQAIIYVGFVVAGIQGAAVQSTPTSVQVSMGTGFNVGWLALLIIGPLGSLLGEFLPDRYRGLVLQISASVAIIFALLTYIVAVMQRRSIGEATFSVWVVGALIVAEFVLISRKVHQLRQVLALAREIERRS